jgi:uncharacterized damage-inducible protein DinB
MTTNFLEKLFEHNNWANLKIIEVCVTLTDEQLDAKPQSASYGSVRDTLTHLVSAQRGYLRTLTLPVEERRGHIPDLAFSELEKSITESGEALLALTRDPSKLFKETQLQTRDDHYVEPWVLMVQIINHATEHREQIKSMLTAMGITPPSIDGWDYGEVTKALVPKPK